MEEDCYSKRITMAHLLKHSTNILKVGNSVFRVRDKFSYSVTNITTGDNNDGIVFDPIVTNNRVFVLNESLNTISVLNASTFSVITTITGITSSPFCICFEPTGSYLLVGCLSGTIYKINATTLVATVIITDAANVTGIAVDPVSGNNRFIIARFVTNNLYVYDATTYALINTLTGLNQPFGIVFDPVIANNRLLVCNNGNGTISVLDGTSLTTLSTITSGGGTTYLAFDPIAANNRFLVVTADSSFKIFNSTTYGLLNTVSSIADHAQCICFDPITINNRFIISNRSGGTSKLSVINQVII
ncbi:MAG: hypothetical protein JWR50_3485 [Mucilaginibacter sp.]|nr:hypothetical protein [Mucilaginibacter sp.]